jgi:CDP-diacylglycerol--glycerol-3-phosphate 3-phosphatidyltransferase
MQERALHKSKVWNLPNQITVVRLVVSLGLFFLLHYEKYFVGMFVFLVGASTDWVDGYVARRTGQVTQLGRIMDPFADKVIVCGTLIFLAAVPDSQIRAWMAVLVVGREMLVTVLRSVLEQQGQDFSATMSGKLKMVFQCAAAVGGLLLASYVTSSTRPPAWLPGTVWTLAWIAVLSTLYSGVVYMIAAARLVRP